MTLRPYEYRNPARLIEEVSERVPLRAGDVYLVLVAHPSTEQRIVKIVLLDLDAEQDDYEHGRRELERLVPRLGIPDVHPITHGVMTVVVRPGLTVLGRIEWLWLAAWRYSNHFVRCFDTDLILVTEHGWADFISDLGDAQPAMVQAS